MRIICFTESLAAGGAQRQLVNLAVLFAKKGHNVDFLVYRNESFFLPILQEAGISVHIIKGEKHFYRLFKCRQYIRSHNVDVVLSFLETPDFISCFSAFGRHRWRVVTTELSAKESTFIGKKNKIYVLFRRVADQIVCNSENARQMWEQYCPQYRNKLSTIYNPVMIPNDCVKLRKAQNLKRRIVVPSSYQYIKNPIRLIEAVRRLPNDIREKLQIEWYGKTEATQGNTAAYDDAQKLVTQYNLGDTVHLYPETTRIYNLISEADAVGLFSTVEGLPNAICEGMMLGKPILMTKISDYKVFSGEDGVFFCDAENTESITHALCSFVNTSDSILVEMGEGNRRLAEKLFDGERIVNQWEELFSDLVNRGNNA